MDAVEQATSKLTSVYSLDRYLGNEKWDMLRQEFRNIAIAGTFNLQVAGRFDIAAQAIYNDPMLDWVLMMYNSIKKIGYDEGLEYKKSLTIALDAGESITEDVPLSYDNISILYNGVTLANVSQDPVTGDMLASLNDSDPASLRISFGGGGTNAALIKNINSSSLEVLIVYTQKEYSNELDVGTLISYPSLSNIQQIFNKVNAEADRKTGALATGFSRL